MLDFIEKMPDSGRRVGCDCSVHFLECTYRGQLKVCCECGHKACDDHCFWVDTDSQGNCRKVRCICCIHRERQHVAALKRAYKDAEKKFGAAVDRSRTPPHHRRRDGTGSSRDC